MANVRRRSISLAIVEIWLMQGLGIEGEGIEERGIEIE